MPDITLNDGMKALEAAFAKARSLNIVVGVSVVDARGDLVASARMDDSLWWWTESSRAKAMATVTYGGIPSGELTERAARARGPDPAAHAPGSHSAPAGSGAY
ncbi:MAG: heme-binding protein [Chloroflexi bacterium]|nr:heme-binding protein [Chloroflexota bacterium]